MGPALDSDIAPACHICSKKGREPGSEVSFALFFLVLTAVPCRGAFLTQHSALCCSVSNTKQTTYVGLQYTRPCTKHENDFCLLQAQGQGDLGAWTTNARSLCCHLGSRANPHTDTQFGTSLLVPKASMKPANYQFNQRGHSVASSGARLSLVL